MFITIQAFTYFCIKLNFQAFIYTLFAATFAYWRALEQVRVKIKALKVGFKQKLVRNHNLRPKLGQKLYFSFFNSGGFFESPCGLFMLAFIQFRRNLRKNKIMPQNCSMFLYQIVTKKEPKVYNVFEYQQESKENI